MLNALRAGASGVILLVMMLGAGLVLWVVVPVGWLFVGSQIQGGTESLGLALLVMFAGVIVSVAGVVYVLAWLNRKHCDLREARGLDNHGTTALEGMMTVSVFVAVIVFAVWFLVLQGPGPSLAPGN